MPLSASERQSGVVLRKWAPFLLVFEGRGRPPSTPPASRAMAAKNKSFAWRERLVPRCEQSAIHPSRKAREGWGITCRVASGEGWATRREITISHERPVVTFRPMSDGAFDNPSPQFSTAEYAGLPGNDRCQFCHQPIAGTYYRVKYAMACSGCVEKMRGELAKDTHTAYVRGLLFGIGTAVLGMILYATFAITTGIFVGYLSLAVGWMVWTAMIKGSGGIGGRRYQITAAALTYVAVSMAAVPVGIHYAVKHRQEQKHQIVAKMQPSDSDEEFERQERKVNPNYSVAPSTPASSSRAASSHAPSSLAAVLVRLALLGIASPFYELWKTGPSIHWVIGIVILIVGIRIAWRITAGRRPLQIYGPFEQSKPAP